MEEVVAGMQKPLDATEMRALLDRYLPRIHAADEAASVLRRRVALGETKIRRQRSRQEQNLPIEVAEDVLQEAEARLAALQGELREQDAMVCFGLATALAHGVASVLANTSKREGWQPPAGSVLTITLPGLLNLGLDLTDPEYRHD